MSRSLLLVCLLSVSLGALDATRVSKQRALQRRASTGLWQKATANNFVLPSLAITVPGSACGYGNRWVDGFGQNRVSASQAVFSGGQTCGACFEIKCDTSKSKNCRKDAVVKTTVTDQCYESKVRGSTGVCSRSTQNFLLPQYVFSLLANPNVATVPIVFRRIECVRKGDIMYQINGSPKYLQINIRNVGNAGTLSKVWIKASGKSGWQQMQRIWGENWAISGRFVGHSLSFKLYSAITKQTVVALGAVPSTWKFGGTFSKGQFH